MSIEVVFEGEATFPAVTLFSTAGAGESTLAFGDINSATWSRKVVGSGETVNSREDVAVSITENPFTIEQVAADNTRVDSDRRYERHEVVVEYLYTRDAASGKAGRTRMEFLIVPVDRVVYAQLTEQSRYLRKVKAGFTEGDALTPDELFFAEEEALELIEGRLGKRFYTAGTRDVPRVIARIAEMLGSACVLDFTHVALSKEQNKYAKKLRDDAEAELDRIVAGKVGVQYADGTWDSDYPAPSRAARKASKGRRRNLVFDRARPWHQQHGHVPTETDDELMGHDDRSARTSEYDE